MNRRTVLSLPLACALPVPAGESLLDRMITIPSDGDPCVERGSASECIVIIDPDRHLPGRGTRILLPLA